MQLFISKQILLISTIVLNTVFLHASNKTDLGLQNAIDQALENNKTLLIAKNGVESANQTVRQAWADALPAARPVAPWSGAVAACVVEPVRPVTPLGSP